MKIELKKRVPFMCTGFCKSYIYIYIPDLLLGLLQLHPFPHPIPFLRLFCALTSQDFV